MTRISAATALSGPDLIVLGAGPAGAAAALEATRLGLKTALIDRARFPREKLCGGGITGRSMTILRDLLGGMPDAPMLHRSEMVFHGFGETLGHVYDAPAIHLGMRWSFDAALVSTALGRGAQDLTGHAGTLDPETMIWRGQGISLSAPLVIAADGVNSLTARALFGAAFDRRQIGFALEIEAPDTDADAPLRIDFGAAEWGYGWRFPKTTGTTIGVGGVLSRNPDMKAALARYLTTLGTRADTPVKGQFLPFGDFRRHPGRGRILLAGDAAGLVDPITGEGIAHALKSGQLAARAAHRALVENRPDKALAHYTRSLRPIHRGLSQARLLRNLIFRERLRPAFLRSFRASRSLRDEYLRLLAGETEYGAILTKVAARLPRHAMRVLRST